MKLVDKRDSKLLNGMCITGVFGNFEIGKNHEEVVVGKMFFDSTTLKLMGIKTLEEVIAKEKRIMAREEVFEETEENFPRSDENPEKTEEIHGFDNYEMG